MFNSIGSTEIILILAVILLLFGGKKIPEFFKGLGDAVKEFKKSSRDTGQADKKS